MNAASTELGDNRNIGAPYASDHNGDKNGCCCCMSSKRCSLVGMLFIGAIAIHSLGVNISASIFEMEPEIEWGSVSMSFALFTYVSLTSIIAAPIVRKFGPVTTYGYALLLAGVVTILNPFIARFNFNLFLCARFLGGSLVMACQVATADILSRWSLKRERFKMVSIVISGTYVGTTTTLPVCTWLAEVYGWPSTFYCTGAIAVLISSAILMWFVDDPSQDKSISKIELELLTRELKDSSNEKITHVWKKMLTAKPLWILLVVKIGFECGGVFSHMYLPLYVHDVIGIGTNNILSLPSVIAILTILLAGLLADCLQNSKILTATQVHKTYIAIGFVLGAMCLFAASLISNFTINLLLLVIFTILSSLGQLTMATLPIYMAPRHSGLIAAIISYGFFIGAFVTQILMNFIITSYRADQWNLVMSLFGAIVLSAGIIFLLFGSSEILEIFRAKSSPENGQNRETSLGIEMNFSKL